ncbi:hypothetical protein MNBD_GAMMA02-744 [hydrothermal vent metagenome]|uniref:DNRLRE domain-containing protein n=1 Tax=hydrothermal vent metagenome TaxID=652676 RepID=A0A3B0WBQ1_9ZZZZ
MILIAFTVTGENIELTTSKDNTAFESSLLAKSNGAGDYFFAGRIAQPADSVRRGLIYFDLSAVPTGSTINDVSLELTSSRSIAGLRTLSIHRAESDWGEGASDSSFMGGGGGGADAEIGDATWLHTFYDQDTWNNVGGDYTATESASTDMIGEQTGEFSSAQLTADVQNWIDGTTDNFGWFVIGDESTLTTAFRFNSRENDDSSTRPKLIIDYSLPQTSMVPAKDNTLYESNDGSTSNGLGGKVFFGKPNNGQLRRGVLEFDVSGLPAFANITSVTVDLTVIDIPGAAQNGSAALHLALAEWGEGTSSGNGQGAPSQADDATWIHTFYDTDTWTTAGGDFMPNASATSNFTDQTNTISFSSSAGLIADVSTWHQDSQNNHGWILLGDEANNGNVRSVGSLNNSTAASRPTLTIEYFVPVDLIFANGFE